MNKPENPRKALGKGLGALLHTRTQAPAGVGEVACGERGLHRRAPQNVLQALGLQLQRVLGAGHGEIARSLQRLAAVGVAQLLPAAPRQPCGEQHASVRRMAKTAAVFFTTPTRSGP